MKPNGNSPFCAYDLEIFSRFKSTHSYRQGEGDDTLVHRQSDRLQFVRCYLGDFGTGNDFSFDWRTVITRHARSEEDST